jgi:hypothetical protein
MKLKVDVANGISVDQVIAQKMTTPLRSLELGLSTLNSFEDGRHPSLSRSIAWATPTQPLYKEVNPQAVFDRLVASGARDAAGVDPEAAKQAKLRKALRLSALDFVRESATGLSQKLAAKTSRGSSSFSARCAIWKSARARSPMRWRRRAQAYASRACARPRPTR